MCAFSLKNMDVGGQHLRVKMTRLVPPKMVSYAFNASTSTTQTSTLVNDDATIVVSASIDDEIGSGLTVGCLHGSNVKICY